MRASIATASTPAEHQRIADFYTKKASEYDATALEHEKNAKAYIGHPKGNPGTMTAHCRGLRDQFSASAKVARELAQMHTQMAAGGAY